MTLKDQRRLLVITEDLRKAGALFERWLGRMLLAAGKVAQLKRRLKRLTAEAARLRTGAPDEPKPEPKAEAKPQPKRGAKRCARRT